MVCREHVLEAGKSKIKLQADSAFGEDQLPGSQTTIFSHCLHMVKNGKRALCSLFNKSLISFMRAPTYGPNYLPSAPPDTITLRVRISIKDLGVE
jgi:hypothetical protein